MRAEQGKSIDGSDIYYKPNIKSQTEDNAKISPRFLSIKKRFQQILAYKCDKSMEKFILYRSKVDLEPNFAQFWILMEISALFIVVTMADF